MKSRLLILLLFITLGTSALFAESGTCGDNVTWTLENGVLTISGDGEMYDYEEVPWFPIRSNIKAIIISNGVRGIGMNAFAWHQNLVFVSIPNSVTYIGAHAFRGCFALTTINIPNSVTSIENDAFFSCSSLNSITIPNSVTSIGSSAFAHCYALTSITIPNSVTSIEYETFSYCGNLTSLTISKSVTNINLGAFLYCDNLTSINVSVDNPNYCSIDGVLFNKDKTTLLYYPHGKENSSYTIPNSVTNINIDCDNLTSINVSTDNPNYCSIDGVLFNKDKTTLLYYPQGKENSSYTIPNSVTSIENGAFYKCSGLTDITIPNSVTNIGSSAFLLCGSLTSVTIPYSVTNIGEEAFSYCEDLREILYPEWLDLSDAGIPSSTKLIPYPAQRPNK